MAVSNLLTCFLSCRWNLSTCQEAGPSVDLIRWTLGDHRHFFSKDIDRKTAVKIDQTQFYLQISCPLPPIRNPHLLSTSQRSRKNENEQSMIGYHLSQHFNIYLRDFLQLATSSTESADPVTGTQIKATPVTSHCSYQWQPVLPLKLSSVQLWWAAVTLNLTWAQTHPYPLVIISACSPDIGLVITR